MTTITDVDQALEEAVNDAVECDYCWRIAAWSMTSKLCPCHTPVCNIHKINEQKYARTRKRDPARRRKSEWGCLRCGIYRKGAYRAVQFTAITYRFEPI